MSSDQQIAANRLNAQRSTGPRTPAGKERVSSNALKHGLTGREVVLPNEDPDDFETFRDGLLANLDPQGELEGVLAEKIVTDAWRLRRVPIFEATLHKRGSAELLTSEAKKLVRQYESTNGELLSAVADKKFVFEKDRSAHEDAQQKLARSRAELKNPSFVVTRVLERYPALFLNLWRHEDAISRSMLRMLHELERLQAKRAGQHIPVPEVVDVDVSVSEPAAVDIIRTEPNGETNGNPQ